MWATCPPNSSGNYMETNTKKAWAGWLFPPMVHGSDISIIA